MAEFSSLEGPVELEEMPLEEEQAPAFDLSIQVSPFFLFPFSFISFSLFSFQSLSMHAPSSVFSIDMVRRTSDGSFVCLSGGEDNRAFLSAYNATQNALLEVTCLTSEKKEC